MLSEAIDICKVQRLSIYFRGRDLRVFSERIRRGLFSWQDLRIFSERVVEDYFRGGI